MKTEITHDLQLTEAQSSLLDMHSVLNVLSVVIANIRLIEIKTGRKDCLADSINHCKHFIDSLTDPDSAINFIYGVPDTKRLIFSDIEELLSKEYGQNIPERILTHQETLKTVFHILDTRVQELLARLRYPGMWTKYKLNELDSNFKAVFKAVEKNSHGSYNIVYNVAAKGANDYLVNFALGSVMIDSISIPGVFMDVMRDLILNARKYTPLGGRITTGLYDDGKLVRFIVQDDGLGIPENQISQVVNFGIRADNVLNKKTMGGGFGLTKAYFVTKQFSGRMWVDTELDRGTKIIIELPHN